MQLNNLYMSNLISKLKHTHNSRCIEPVQYVMVPDKIYYAFNAYEITAVEEPKDIVLEFLMVMDPTNIHTIELYYVCGVKANVLSVYSTPTGKSIKRSMTDYELGYLVGTLNEWVRDKRLINPAYLKQTVSN